MHGRGPTPLSLTRRTILQCAALAAVPGRLTAGDPGAEARAYAASLPIEAFNSFGPPELYFKYLRRAFFDEAYGRPFVERLWNEYERTKNVEYGEWSLHSLYFWWRTHKDRRERIRVAQAGYKMAVQFSRDTPGHPAGSVMAAIFIGAEGLARGVLNALQLIPELHRRLSDSLAVDPHYMYGLAYCVLGKLYTKVPPFPMSIGDLDKAEEAFAKARPVAQGRFAPWYLFRAELELQRHGRDAAFAVLDAMEAEVKPVDVATTYLFDSMISDGRTFRKAIDEHTYDKYTWDPVLEPAKRGLELLQPGQ